MTEVTQYKFSFKEIAAELIRREGLKIGHWTIFVEFGLTGINITDESGKNALPAAIVPIKAIGLQRVDAPTPLSVDAAEIAKKKTRKARSSKTKEAG